CKLPKQYRINAIICQDISEYKLWQQSPESRSFRALKMYIEEILLPKIGHTKDKISEKTCHTYMHTLGYKYDERKKGVYYDEHK
ncbi:3582_t:CDS:2, partial [Gigaspora margarita]